MKHLFVIVIFILSFLSTQAQQDLTEGGKVFPLIGYGDFVYLTQYPFYNNFQPYTSTSYSGAEKYYYPLLESLGLTHVVTFGETQSSLNPQINPSLKLLDVYFTVRASRFSDNIPYYAAAYTAAQGNSPDFFPYQVGGDKKAGFGKEDGYGYGTKNKTSRWITLQKGKSVSDGSENVFHIEETDSKAKTLFMTAAFPGDHQARGTLFDKKDPNFLTYQVMINAKLDGTRKFPPGTSILTVVIETINAASVNEKEDYKESADDAAKQLLTFTVPSDSFAVGSYKNIILPPFENEGGDSRSIRVKIFYEGKGAVSVDYMCVFDKYYKRLFMSSADTVSFYSNLILKNIEQKFKEGYKNKNLAQFYQDEPYPNSYRAIGYVNSLLRRSSFNRLFVNGAYGGYKKYQLQMMSDFYAFDSGSRIPYVMEDRYIIDWFFGLSDEPYEQGSQNALDRLIRDLDVTNPSMQRGLRAGIEYAQNFNEEPSDDVPMIWTLQVQGEAWVKSNSVASPKLRPPTPNEILAQGFIAIAYGAKGLMYYTLTTQTPNPNNKESVVANYGLFDAVGTAFQYKPSEKTAKNFVQDPQKPQVPNDRYAAVKKLNEMVQSLAPTLLKLTWVDGYSLHRSNERQGMKKTYVKEIVSVKKCTTGECEDGKDVTFVEAGFFKETSRFQSTDVCYLVLVNRRTQQDGERKISVTLDMTKFSAKKQWRVTDIASGETFTIGSDGTFQSSYAPGTGKLFRIEAIR